jgi:AcrR family transcriptional regulator
MPRAGLTPSVVVAEAASLADEVGWEHLTLAALAGRLGVAVPSLYKHVDGLDGVRRGVTLLALAEMAGVFERSLAAVPGRDAHARLRALTAAYRGYARTHPGRYAATVRAASPDDQEHGAASDAVMRTVFAVLAERGLTGDDAIDAARVLRASLHGFVTLEGAGGFGLPRDVGRSFDRLVEGLDRAL